MGKNNHRKSIGFSLIELLVVVAMLALLTVAIGGALNPLTQINKAKDGKRENNLNQIKVALDTYYNDTGCYPQSVPFGSVWSVNTIVLMQKVPQDVDCLVSAPNCYLYETDTTTTCPQWNVLYGELANPKVTQSSTKTLCALESITASGSSCKPTDYTSKGYNFCLLSGNPDCTYISNNPLPTPIFPSPTSTPAPTPTPTPADHCIGMQQSNPNYHRYVCVAGVCNDAGQGNGTYCISSCESQCH